MNYVINQFQGMYSKVRSSKGLQIGILGFVTYVCLLGLWFSSQMSTGVTVVLDGKALAVAKEETQVNSVLTDLSKKQEAVLGQKVELKNNIVFEPSNSKEEPLGDEALAGILAKNLVYTTEATAIKVNGEIKVVVQNDNVAKGVIDALKQVEISNAQNVTIEEVKIEEEIAFVKVEKDIKDIDSKDKAIEQLKYTNEEKNKVHTIAEGESLWTIAEKYELSVDELIAANPELDPGALQIGQALSISKAEPVVSVLVIAKAKMVEELPYQTEVKKDFNLPRGKEKIQQEGTKGKAENTYSIVYKNNVPVQKSLVEAKTIEAPKPKVVLRGAKSIVVASRSGGSASASWSGGGSGNFGWPAQGRITSPFGDGRGHAGIDIANSSGTGIYAAEGGVVVFSSYSGGYGNHIDIDHGNGYVTRYAHNSSNLVSVGDRVSRGQLIAYMGSTGRSTGPHLHFEVRSGGRWGTPLNPINFLR